jgi:hypothetical protein
MSVQSVGVREFAVLAPIDADAQELTAREVLAPRMYTGGVGSTLHDLVGRTESTIVWFLEWPDGLKVAVGIGLGDVPDAESLYRIAQENSGASALYSMKTANELPA